VHLDVQSDGRTGLEAHEDRRLQLLARVHAKLFPKKLNIFNKYYINNK
jgi:hypothetical protein